MNYLFDMKNLIILIKAIITATIAVIIIYISFCIIFWDINWISSGGKNETFARLCIGGMWGIVTLGLYFESKEKKS